MGRTGKRTGNYLDEVPVRLQSRIWSEDENGRVVIDMENRGFANKIAQMLFHKPRVSHISLDAYGTVVWKEIDGTQTVSEIVDAARRQFPDEERMSGRVLTFLATLQAHGLVAMRGERIRRMPIDEATID